MRVGSPLMTLRLLCTLLILILKENSGTKQKQDSSLIQTWESAIMNNGEPFRLWLSYFISKQDLFYLIYKKTYEIIEQLVVGSPQAIQNNGTGIHPQALVTGSFGFEGKH